MGVFADALHFAPHDAGRKALMLRQSFGPPAASDNRPGYSVVAAASIQA